MFHPPISILIDENGNQLPTGDGYAVGLTPGLIVAGSDGTNARFISTDESGHVHTIDGYTESIDSKVSTSALQTTGNSSLSSIDTKTPTVGQKPMSGSSPVVIASDQSPVIVNPTTSILVNNTAIGTVVLSGNTFTASYDQVDGYAELVVLLTSTQSGTLFFDFSMDGITADFTQSFNTSGNEAPQPIMVVAKYFRVRWINTSVSSATIRLQTLARSSAAGNFYQRLCDETDDQTPAIVTTSQLIGETVGGGVHKKVNLTSLGHLEVSAIDPNSAFGELTTHTNYPLFQFDFVYGLIPDLINTQTLNAGSITTSNSLMTASTGTNANGLVRCFSKRNLKYRSGQGATVRYTALFSDGYANSQQYAGPISSSNGFAFGYNGTSFGILHRRGGVRQIMTLTITNPGGTETVTITLDGYTKTTALVSGGSAILAADQIGATDYSQTDGGWDAYPVGSTVIFVARDARLHSGTFSMTSNGAATGTFATTSAGLAPTDTWIPQSSWNIDVMSGVMFDETCPSGVLLNPQKGNVFVITYQYLGFGDIFFYVENPLSGHFTPVHQIQYPNANTVTSVTNPSTNLSWFAINQGNTSNVSISGASGAGFVQGQIRRIGAKRASSSAKTNIGTGSWTSVLTLKNTLVYANKVNFLEAHLHLLSTIVTDAGGCDFALISNGILSGTPNWTSVDGYSFMLADTAGTTVTGGTINYILSLGGTGSSSQIDLNDFDIVVAPGDTISFAAKSETGVADVVCSISWIEDV